MRFSFHFHYCSLSFVRIYFLPHLHRFWYWSKLEGFGVLTIDSYGDASRNSLKTLRLNRNFSFLVLSVKNFTQRFFFFFFLVPLRRILLSYLFIWSVEQKKGALLLRWAAVFSEAANDAYKGRKSRLASKWLSYFWYEKHEFSLIRKT